jgi:hypothetical protein
MRRILVGLMVAALLSGASSGCAVGVATLVGGAAAEGWFLGKSTAEKTPAEASNKETADDHKPSR